MSFAMFFLVASLLAELVLSTYYFLTANEIEETKNNSDNARIRSLGLMIGGWKKSLVIFTGCFLIFIIYYASLMVSMQDVTNVYGAAGTIENTIKTEDWRLGWEFLKIMVAVTIIDFAVLVWRIMNQTSILVGLFGARAKPKKSWGF